MTDTLFDVKKLETDKRCNQCKFFYRKYWSNSKKSWGKCELHKSSYDAPAKRLACMSFKPNGKNE